MKNEYTQAVQKGSDARNVEACAARVLTVRKQANAGATQQMDLYQQPATLFAMVMQNRYYCKL